MIYFDNLAFFDRKVDILSGLSKHTRYTSMTYIDGIGGHLKLYYVYSKISTVSSSMKVWSKATKTGTDNIQRHIFFGIL